MEYVPSFSPPSAEKSLPQIVPGIAKKAVKAKELHGRTYIAVYFAIFDELPQVTGRNEFLYRNVCSNLA